MSPQPPQDQPPAIRIVPHIEGPRSLHFDIIEREIPEGVVIKIGRFTDKAHVPNRVTFKSKVVSRGHAEIWCEGGKFFIRDTKSSSGTFLNHNRLSAPGLESKAIPLKDGDVVQLGVDYQGGTEEIYRCVKMRIELNRSWQRQVNPFNLNALKQFKQLTSPDGFKPTTDCCICLCGIGPCQALFLAPCSHVFHYKCIRPLLVNYHPGFLCPLCRSFADLDAPIDNPVDWKQLLAEQEEAEKKQNEEALKSETNEQSTQEQITEINHNNIPSTSQLTNTVESLNTNKDEKIQLSSHLMSQEEINKFGRSSVSTTPAPSSSYFPVPIPPRNRKTSNSSDEGDDPNSMLSRTLPSSPPSVQIMPFLDESIDNGSSAQSSHQLLREQAGSPRLGEIAEEDEGTMSSSSNPSGQSQNHGTHDSSSSASSSDNDDDGVPIGLLRSNVNGHNEDDISNGYVELSSNEQAASSRVKGKGVDRLGIDENERENVS
ncbi:6200_t:CDS:2 [Funneliformis caledonium]|uniref:6200_t:CDS:1 n=1 Tax=Funneliformis caledonium TaxID=1117310 RepID=A0A9N8VAU3_9GLOM|nr:6200_t:CDS:2 [Funneliformis caledonium]